MLSWQTISPILLKDVRGNITIDNNRIDDNIGLHGGAINIEKPLIMAGREAINVSIAIRNNSFNRNMAYIAGNSIFISSPSKEDETESDTQPVNILISGCNFTLNYGQSGT